MKVTLNKEFPMEGTVEAGWQCLQDIETVAGCMPGAEITEKTDEENFKGKVKVKLGPVVMAFNGDIVVKSINDEERKIHLIASGKDSKGTSSATMDLTAQIRSGESNDCLLLGDADVIVNGKLANFGGRMMTQVADQILSQFAANFAENLVSSSSGSAESAASGSEQKQTSNDTPKEINGFSIAWNVVIGFFKSFFTKAT
ncbi:MAG: carbon monoxide dehydrogenase subunit G [Gammaproteobacteria bacterium]|jgi:carbon monoxide dehydrogenase subunit G